MSIPVGHSHTCTVSGRAIRRVQCVNCGGEYFYIVERKITAESFSPLFLNEAGAAQRAKDAALSRLEEGLSRDCELIPCPDCGHYQPDMLRKLRTNRFLAMLALWTFLCLSVLIIYFTSESGSAVELFVQKHVSGLIALAAVLLGVGIWAVVIINPNRSPEERIMRGPDPDARALRRVDLEAMMAGQQWR